MDRDRISQTQLSALLWAGLLAPAAELLPAVTLPQAGRGAWLTGVMAMPVVMLLGLALGRLGRGPGGLAGAIRRGLGPVMGRALLLLYLLWGECLLALRLRLCAQRLLASGERDGSLWFFLPAAALLALWMARGRLAAFARAGQIFLGVLAVTGAAVLALSLPQLRGEHLLPVWWGEARGALRGTLPALGVLGYGIYAGFLLGDMAPAERGRRDWLLWSGGGCLILALEQAVAIGSLGPALAGRMTAPFFTLAKSVGVEGAFQRVESIVAALWTMADFTLLGVLLFAQWKLAAGIFPPVRQKPAVTAAVLPAAAAGIAAFPDGFAAESAGRTLALAGNLLLGVALPLLLLPVLRWREHISCGGERDKTEDIVLEEKVEKKSKKQEKSG